MDPLHSRTLDLQLQFFRTLTTPHFYSKCYNIFRIFQNHLKLKIENNSFCVKLKVRCVKVGCWGFVNCSVSTITCLFFYVVSSWSIFPQSTSWVLRPDRCTRPQSRRRSTSSGSKRTKSLSSSGSRVRLINGKEQLVSTLIQFHFKMHYYSGASTFGHCILSVGVLFFL